MCLSTWAIILAIAGGLFEAIGVGMVIRDIGSDRKRAARLLAPERFPPRKRRRYPKVPVPTGSASPGDRAFYGMPPLDAVALKAQVEKALAETGNLIIEVKQRVDDDRDALEVKLTAEIDKGDAQLRESFREILESDLTERWLSVGALLIGIALAATASVLGSLS